MPNDKEFLAALDTLDSQIGGTPKLTALEGADLCAQYRKLKLTIETVLKVVDLIPVYGKRIADVIRFLMRIADSLCPI